MATVVIVMNGSSAVDIILNVHTIAGSATSMISINLMLTNDHHHDHITCLVAPMDFMAVNERLTIPAGSTNASLNIPIVDDNILENTERFSVFIGEVTQPRVTTVGPIPTTLYIIDNDG